MIRMSSAASASARLIAERSQRLRMIVDFEHGEGGRGPCGKLAHHVGVGCAAYDNDPAADKIAH